MNDPQVQKQVRRNALILGAVALAVFFAFIGATMLRGGVAG
ncbi:MAG: hypothetical protein AAFN07_00025 [Pseudomonadota bacterium]